MEDLIRRSDAIAILEDLQSKHLQFCLVPFRIAIEKMEAIPSADIDLSGYSDKLWKNAYERGKADRPRGELKYMGTYYKCSVCGSEFMDEITFMGELNYCPACGADIRGVDDE